MAASSTRHIEPLLPSEQGAAAPRTGVVPLGLRRFGPMGSPVWAPHPVYPDFGTGPQSWTSDATFDLVFTFDTNGVRTTFSTADTPLVFTFDTAGSHTAIGSTVGRNINFDFFTNGVRTTFSTADTPLVFNIDTQGFRVTYGAADVPLALNIDTAGTLYKRGSVDTPISFNIDTPTGKVGAFSTSDLPLTFTLDTTGTGGEAEGGSRMLQVDKEHLKSEPWPGFPDLPKPRVGKPAKPGYMRKRDA